MKTLYMMKGLPACGKSTRAKKLQGSLPKGAAKIVNRDQLRLMLDGGEWSKENEKFVVGVRDYVITAALIAGKHVIVDDTNLSPDVQGRLHYLAHQHGAQVQVIDMTDVTVEECIKRDQRRPNYVGEKVIRDMYQRYLAPKPPVIEYDPNLPNCIIIDIDGTAAKMVARMPFDWDKVHTDVPNMPVKHLLDMIDASAAILFVSGRDEGCRDLTTSWLDHNLFRGHTGMYKLFMRPAGDNRDDTIVKREIYEREVKGKYNVLFILDDRNKVVAQWRELGLPCFQVQLGDF